MNKHEVASQERQLIAPFPNTYTYTKNLSEKNLWSKRGEVTLCIVRPAIIASTNSDPFPGWTDSISAAGGITYLTGLGIIHHL